MPFKKHFQSMPTPILVMFFVFLLTPLVSLSFIERPWVIYAREGFWRATTVTLTYWLIPLGLCYALAFKHYLFLPLYGGQCLALLLHSILYSNTLPLDMALARYVLIAFMAYIGFFFGNKDILYPFLTKDFRIWRKTRRLRVTYEIQLMGDRPEHRIPAKIKDCSAVGMAVSIEQKHLQSFLQKKSEGDRLTAVIRWLGQERAFPAEIVWTSSSEKARSLGLRVARNMGLSEFVDWIKGELLYESRLYRTASPLLEHDVHQTALTFWVLFIALSFGLPAFALL